ncbi:MAG: Shikimate kinase I, partial [uncultured Nocardioidaceae bacterium]
DRQRPRGRWSGRPSGGPRRPDGRRQDDGRCRARCGVGRAAARHRRGRRGGAGQVDRRPVRRRGRGLVPGAGAPGGRHRPHRAPRRAGARRRSCPRPAHPCGPRGPHRGVPRRRAGRREPAGGSGSRSSVAAGRGADADQAAARRAAAGVPGGRDGGGEHRRQAGRGGGRRGAGRGRGGRGRPGV